MIVIDLRNFRTAAERLRVKRRNEEAENNGR
jgi:hypothetical protein